MILALVLLFAGTGARAQAPLAVVATEPPPPDSEKGRDVTGAYDDWHRPLAQPAAMVALTGTSDPFGYTLDDSVTYAWEDLAVKGVQAQFPDPDDPDDQYTDLINIGFAFKFYENTYQQLSIGTNGFVTFETGSSSFSNQFLPLDTDPNNMIAPFWDDLHLSVGHVYYWLDNASPRRFVIEWHQVVKFGSTDLLTFEIILYENGNILFQYQDLNGDVANATVGIEDRDGVNGLLYLYNSPGLTPGEAVLFTRPAPVARTKIQPVYQSALNHNIYTQFQATVSNIGELGSDTLNLTALSSAPGWNVSFYHADNSTILTDTNGDSLVDTGLLPQGASFVVSFRVTAPESAQATDYTEITLYATSSLDDSKYVAATVQVAVPAPFAQAYADSQSGMHLNQVWALNSRRKQVATYFTGNTLSIDGRLGGKYIYSWEKNGFSAGVNYSNIEYLILNKFGFVYKPTTVLTHNENEATPTLLVNARYPAVSVAGDGRYALIWVQYKLDLSALPNIRRNSNVWFVILNVQGNPVYGPVNLTNNNQWRGQGDFNIPLYSSPRLIATDDNRFLLGWLDNRLDTGDNEVNRIYYASYTTGGTQVTAGPQLLSQSVAGSTLLLDPDLVTANPGALFAYTIYNQVSKTYSIAYAMLNSAGVVTKSPAIIPGSSGWRSDGVRVSTGNLVLAWNNPATDRIAYAVLNASGNALLFGPTDLPLAGARKPDYVSATFDADGHAILTWLDVEWNDFLYYAALDGDGSVLTPPMIFFSGDSDNPLIQTSFSGQGIAPYEGVWDTFLAFVRR
ncbi:MAG TPA: nidogen-like domain-containing protein [Anaerolineales bacterium]|nr:nidogen-like domain-containing protein [Anaerolineales bacterium]